MMALRLVLPPPGPQQAQPYQSRARQPDRGRYRGVVDETFTGTLIVDRETLDVDADAQGTAPPRHQGIVKCLARY